MKKIPENVRAAMIFAGAIIVLVILIKVVPTLKSNTLTGNHRLPSSIKPVTVEDQVAKDTDGDGILDWEERLWGTDPYLVDTDEDGINDNIEIDEARQTMRLSSGGAGASPTTTAAAALGQELVMAIASLEEGQYISKTQLDAFVSGIGQQLSIPTRDWTIPTNQLVENSPKTIETYYETFLEAVDAYPASADAALGAIENWYAVGTGFDFSGVGEQVASVSNNLLEMQVPQRFATIHQSLMEGYWGLGMSISYMQYIKSDPLRALPALGSYISYRDQLASDLERVNMYFVQSGILNR